MIGIFLGGVATMNAARAMYKRAVNEGMQKKTDVDAWIESAWAVCRTFGGEEVKYELFRMEMQRRSEERYEDWLDRRLPIHVNL